MSRLRKHTQKFTTFLCSNNCLFGISCCYILDRKYLSTNDGNIKFCDIAVLTSRIKEVVADIVIDLEKSQLIYNHSSKSNFDGYFFLQSQFELLILHFDTFRFLIFLGFCIFVILLFNILYLIKRIKK